MDAWGFTYKTSPSSRRAWIEICGPAPGGGPRGVALLAEGVDRNPRGCSCRRCSFASPSSRRAWIEILRGDNNGDACTSPSSRRAWIEMYGKRAFVVIPSVALLAEGVDRNLQLCFQQSDIAASPSSRRAWIEISSLMRRRIVDWGRPPRGGRG